MTARPARSGRAGFSLLEVMIALIVLSLVMGSAVALLRSQTRGFATGADRTDLYQNGRYIITTLERIIRTEGAGVAGTQPMIVYGDGNTFAFNADYAESDTADMRWAVYFNPDADSVGAVAWDSAAATTIPNSSPTYTYPSANYRMANGATGSAETVILYFSADGTTGRTDDYTLSLRFNALAPTVVARNILADSLGRPFFEYLRISSNTLITVPNGNLPLMRRPLISGITTADSLAYQLPDSVRAVRLNFRVTNGKVGVDERRWSVSTVVEVPNNGLPQPIVCGRTPLGPVTVTAWWDGVAGSETDSLSWTASPDDGGAELDVRQYIIYRHDDTAVPSPPWELLANVRADGSPTYTWVSGGNTAGVVYRFAVVAQDCTPNVSSFVVDTALTN
ncbi:MAG: prepilin-type N-terminal cleavage/methylation domain-containing protein [Gemmatimonadales bacterium]|nr:prepilin-type N-terminal cleavage/methylation domain-containing protein [Gemmatimonadota bacterium]MBP6669736.1 prepilin-type N-terminal cleavage/methylation domain-containing protein [Gemmatimonadales bacterium]